MMRPARLLLLLATAACTKSPPVEAPAPDAPATPSTIPAVPGDTIEKEGMRYVEVREGTGALAERNRCVHTRYVGWLATGRLFDFLLDTAQGRPVDPLGFVIGQKKVIRGWEIGIEGMREGGYRRLLIPWQLGYGQSGNPPKIPSRADLVFDVELVKVSPARIGGSSTSPALECLPYRR